MKTITLKFFTVLLTIAIAVLTIGCGKDDEKPERQKVIDTWTFHYYKQQGRYLVGNNNKQPYQYCVWNENGTAFNIFFVQDGIITPGGSVNSNETTLTEEERNSIDLTYNVDVPSSIRRENQYDYNVIAFRGVNTLTDGNIVITTDLKRDNKVYLWDVGYTSKKGNNVEQNTYSKSIYTEERLLIKNQTDKLITVKHKGFETDEKWYWTKATISITPQLEVIPKGVSQSGEVESEILEIESNKNASLCSHYIPTGKHMKDARLVLEIDGKIVKTTPESSDIDIKYGNCYFMAVKWDGENLDWVYDIDKDF